MSLKYAYDRTIKPPLGHKAHSLVHMLLLSWQSLGFIRTASKLCAGLFIFALTWLWNVRLFLFWCLSRKVNESEYAFRNATCDACPSQVIEDGKKWCGSCGCPRWHYSELAVKNMYAGHNCPLGKHPGSVALPVIQQPQATTGCTGCGDKA